MVAEILETADIMNVPSVSVERTVDLMRDVQILAVLEIHHHQQTAIMDENNMKRRK